MPDVTDPFRDFGIICEGLSPPADCIRCFLSRGQIILRNVGIGIWTTIGLVVTLGPLLLIDEEPLLICSSAVFSWAFGYSIWFFFGSTYEWVEVDSATIRAKNILTKRITENRLEEIKELQTILRPDMAGLGFPGMILRHYRDQWFGRIWGFKVKIKGRWLPIAIYHDDPPMANARQCVEAIIYHLSKARGIDTEIVDLDGMPLVKRIMPKCKSR